ncbi:MAG: hypothetical protein J5547_00735, partial [Clostridia bacterium]|nr:hypothetical protein [Clostridia bacterium]
ATLTFESPTETGTARLVVTAFNKVTYLKRISFGPLELDSSLAEG